MYVTYSITKVFFKKKKKKKNVTQHDYDIQKQFFIIVGSIDSVTFRI